MKIIKANTLFDGINEKKNCFIGFEHDEIKFVGNNKPDDAEIIAEGENIVVTPAFIDSHSHIGLVRSGEPSGEAEDNEHMDSIYPLANAIHSVYMDDSAFSDSIESGVLYSIVLPGSSNVIGGKAVLIRNFAKDIEEAYLKDIGIKIALGYNPRSRIDWKGNRPSSRMGVIAMIRDNFIKARKIQNLLRIEKKVIDEIDPTTELFIDILSNKYKLMVHLHKEDDAIILVQLVKEFGIKAIANHCLGIQREEVFAALKAVSIPVIYGPMDSFSNKIELKHDRWRNAKVLLKSKVRFSLMSDHPIILQRNIFYTLRHLLRLGLSKSNAISKITSEAAEILGIENLGQIKEGFKASMIGWNGDPFSITSYPILVIGEGKIVYKE